MHSSEPERQSGQTPPGAPVELTEAVLQDFDAEARAALETFKVPGAAIALFQGNKIVYNRGLGVRDLQSKAAVTPRTRFRIGSNTKSMTALQLAQLVDAGQLGWDTRAIDLWAEFRAPTSELTQSLRIRDLLGMGSGVADSTNIEFFMSGGTMSALDLLHSVAYLPVIAPPNTTFYYNNTLYAAAPYLALIAGQTDVTALEEAYATRIQQRVFEPIGMADAAIASDPRRLGDDYAVGYTRDLFGRHSALPFISIDGVAPSGSGLASATDMARYVITQMNGGVTPEGRRIVSAASLSATHQPGISVTAGNPPGVTLPPDTTAAHYGLGWFNQTFTDGRHLIWHGGGIDGFASWMGFFPEAQLGLVVLTNQEPGWGGAIYTSVMMATLASRLFGIEEELLAIANAQASTAEQQLAALAAQSRPVDPAAVRPYLGLYSSGFRLRQDASGALYLDHDIRSLPLLALSDGGYIVADGPAAVLAKKVTFATVADGRPTMTIEGFEPVTWLTGS